MKTFFIVVACITLVAFVGACDSESRRGDPVRQNTPKKYQKVEPEKKAIQRKKSSKKQRLGNRERYEAYVNARLQDYESRLDEIKLRAMHSSGHSKKRAVRNVRELERKLHDAHAQYNELKNAKGRNWATSKKRMDQSFENMKTFSR